MAKIGDTIRILFMEGEPQYANREGVVRHIDDMNGIHGSWGGLALMFSDDWEIIKSADE